MPEKIRRDLINAAASARLRNGSLIGELFQTVCLLAALKRSVLLQSSSRKWAQSESSG